MIEIIKALLKKQKILIAAYILFVIAAFVLRVIAKPEKSEAIFILILIAANFFIWISMAALLPVILGNSSAKVIPDYPAKIKQTLLVLSLVVCTPMLAILPNIEMLLTGLSGLSLLVIFSLLTAYYPKLWMILAVCYVAGFVMDKTAWGLVKENITLLAYGLPILALGQWWLINNIDKLSMPEDKLKRLKKLVNITNTKQMYSEQGMYNAAFSNNIFSRLNSYKAKSSLKKGNALNTQKISYIATFGQNNVGIGTIVLYILMFTVMLVAYSFFRLKSGKDISDNAIIAILSVVNLIIVASSFNASFMFFHSIKKRYFYLRTTPLFNDDKMLRINFINQFVVHNIKNALAATVIVLAIIAIMLGLEALADGWFIVLGIAASLMASLGISLAYLFKSTYRLWLYNCLLVGAFMLATAAAAFVNKEGFSNVALLTLWTLLMFGVILTGYQYMKWSKRDPEWHAGRLAS